MRRAMWVPRRRYLVIGVLTIMAVVLAGSFVQAQAPSPPAASPAVHSTEGWGEEGIREVGVEWINDFPGTGDDRSHWDESCDGLYNRLLSEGWTSRFHWTDWSAYETDFKNESRGGSEDTYADRADIAMICTHGSGAWDDFWSVNLSSVYFGSTHTDQDLVPGDAYLGYGDQDLEWLAFDSCSVLSDGGAAPYYNRGYWAATMNGLHLLLGFNNTMYVNYPGDGLLWGYYMMGMPWPWGGWILPPLKVTQSWFLAVDYVQPNVTCARVLAEVQNNYNDYIHGRGYVSPDPVHDTTYWYWDHCSTHALFLREFPSVDQVIAVPVLQVVNRQVDESYVLDRIVPAFQMTGTLGADEQFFFLVDTAGGMTRTLQVDRASGGFNYLVPGMLWTPPIVTPTLPSFDRALALVDSFFSQQGEALPGAWYRNGGVEVTLEQLTEVQMPSLETGGQERVLAVVPTNLALTYNRVITPVVTTVSGSQLQSFPIVGPGGRIKVYIGDQDEIIGMQGGSRDLMQTGGMVDVMTSDEAWAMYLDNPRVALLEVPWVADQIVPTSAVLGYYEHPQFIPQSDLVPVWIFTADFYAGGELLAPDVAIYVPAAVEYLPPQVQIDTPPPGAAFLPGVPIAFSGSVVQHGKPPFTFEWSASHDGPLGTGASIVAPLSTSVKGSYLYTQTVSLQVTDANGQHGTATTTVLIQAALYLPVLYR